MCTRPGWSGRRIWSSSGATANGCSVAWTSTVGRGARTDTEIAGVLARMRADDAADAVAELPQRRRQPVLDLLPPAQRTKVLTLMGFNSASAGGLMGVDFLAVPAGVSVQEALAAVARSSSLQPEALTSVH